MRNIVRKSNGLTGERIRKAPEFEGLRKSCNRMKEASPIAAALYRRVPKEIRQFSLYRLLTGEVLKLLKAGAESSKVTEDLKRIHIDPLLNLPAKEMVTKERRRPEKAKTYNGLPDFTRYFPILTFRKQRMKRSQRFLHGESEQNTDNQLSKEIIPMPDSENTWGVVPAMHNGDQLSDAVSVSDAIKPDTPTPLFPPLIYMGRLPECKKIKMWYRASLSVTEFDEPVKRKKYPENTEL